MLYLQKLGSAKDVLAKTDIIIKNLLENRTLIFIPGQYKLLVYYRQKYFFYQARYHVARDMPTQAVRYIIDSLNFKEVYERKLRTKSLQLLLEISRNNNMRRKINFIQEFITFTEMKHKKVHFLLDCTFEALENLNYHSKILSPVFFDL